MGYILNVTREIDNFFPGNFEYFNVRLYDLDSSELMKHWHKTYKFIKRAKYVIVLSSYRHHIVIVPEYCCFWMCGPLNNVRVLVLVAVLPDVKSACFVLGFAGTATAKF